MKLYYKPGACSLSPHIVLNEGDFTYECEMVDFATGKTESGADYKTINPNGYVPALQLDNGDILTEGPAIVQYLADRVPEKHLAPANGTMQRYHLIAWLNFIATELHKSIGASFNKQTPEAWKDLIKTRMPQRFDYVSDQLDGKTWLTGDNFSVADAYLFTVLSWCKGVDIDLASWPIITAYLKRVGERPAVVAALKQEGIIK
jgi:glutathione S-transferase